MPSNGTRIRSVEGDADAAFVKTTGTRGKNCAFSFASISSSTLEGLVVVQRLGGRLPDDVVLWLARR